MREKVRRDDDGELDMRELKVREPEEPEGDRRTADTKALVIEGRALLTQVLALMGERAMVETVCDDDPEMLELNVKGDGSGLLIGRHGQTLDALEYAINRILARKIKDAPPISIDTESYRARRRGQLHRMALARGEEAKREHQAVTLEPMPARDRRVVHLALKDDPLLTTRSAGEGFLRAIQIVPVDERRNSGAANRGRDPRRDREPRPERDPRREPDRDPRDDTPPPVGEQGGFRHGQKRIV
jgi:spoIIIJ-associated protein